MRRSGCSTRQVRARRAWSARAGAQPRALLQTALPLGEQTEFPTHEIHTRNAFQHSIPSFPQASLAACSFCRLTTSCWSRPSARPSSTCCAACCRPTTPTCSRTSTRSWSRCTGSSPSHPRAPATARCAAPRGALPRARCCLQPPVTRPSCSAARGAPARRTLDAPAACWDVPADWEVARPARRPSSKARPRLNLRALLLPPRQVRFVIMNNLFDTGLQIHERYDLKGSTLGRTAGKEAIERVRRAPRTPIIITTLPRTLGPEPSARVPARPARHSSRHLPARARPHMLSPPSRPSRVTRGWCLRTWTWGARRSSWRRSGTTGSWSRWVGGGGPQGAGETGRSGGGTEGGERVGVGGESRAAALASAPATACRRAAARPRAEPARPPAPLAPCCAADRLGLCPP